MGAAGISAGKCAVLALLVLAVSVLAIAAVASSDDSSADSETSWISGGIVYTKIGDTQNLRVDGPLSSERSSLTEMEIRNTMTFDTIKYTPTEIAPEAFKNCISLRSITIPVNIISIGGNAFSGCDQLESITVPGIDVMIYDYAFANSGIKTADIGNRMESIRPHIFEGCIKLTSVKIYSEIQSIGAFAFKDCISLTSIDIPNITKLGEGAFYNCTSLEKITFPESITEMGNSILNNCSKIKEATIPMGIDTIPEAMFKGCTSLKKVVFYENIRTIGSDAFSGCTVLSDIVLGDTVKSIGERTFNGCINLTDVRITSDVRYIGEQAFIGCSGIVYLTLPNTVSVAGEDIFGTTVFYDEYGKVIKDQSQLFGYSYEMKNGKMTRCDGCYYVVSYDVDGGSVPMSNINENMGSKTVIGEYAGVKEGMIFKGWECEGVDYMIGDTFTMPGHSVQMNIIWEKYVPPQDTSLINQEAFRFIVWAAISVLFGIIILSTSLYIIYRRRT